MMSSPSRTTSNHTLSLGVELTTLPPKAKNDEDEEVQHLDSALSEALSISEDAVMSTTTTTGMRVGMMSMMSMSETSAGGLSDIDLACQFGCEWLNYSDGLHDDCAGKQRPLLRHRRSSGSHNEHSNYNYNHNHNHNNGSQIWSPMLLRYLEQPEPGIYTGARWFGGAARLSDDDSGCDGEWYGVERNLGSEWEWEWGVQSDEEEEEEEEYTDTDAAMCCGVGDGGGGVLDLVGIGTWAESSCEEEMMWMDDGDDWDEWITGSDCV